MDENKRIPEIKATYHNHTYLCGHAKGKPVDYVKRAIEMKYQEIGISDHGPVPFKNWNGRMNLDEFENVYLKEIEEAKSLYGDKIKIYKALEIEYYENHDSYYKYLLTKVDYLILGVHAYPKGNNEEDGNIFGKNITKEDLIFYTEQVIKGIKSGFFKILAHPDVYMCKWTEWTNLTASLAHKIFKCAEEYGIIIEMNANGVRRGTIINGKNEETYKYPRLEFWRISKEYNLQIIVSDDAHFPEAIGSEAIGKVYELARELDINILSKLEI